MPRRTTPCWIVSAFMLGLAPSVMAQHVGSIRGVVHDKDFDVPLSGVQVTTVETGQRAFTSDQGSFVLTLVPPGAYTVVFTKDGYVRHVEADVRVRPAQLTDLEVWLAGEFTEMEEFVVQDVLGFDLGSESALLELRLEAPALMDSIGADLISRAGASDAASALRLVAGASVVDGRFAVIRGLPDRYVNSQMNGVRLPTADEDKRAVELDQFPAAVIESLQVTKTFMPDQQGDASGGAVNVRLKGIPEETIFQVKSQVSYDSQASGRSDFLTYEGGGVSFWGKDDGDKDMQLESLGGNWDGAVGVSRDDAPINSKWSLAAGGKRDLGEGLRLGGFASFFYERDSSFFDNGVNDSYWVENPGDPPTPEIVQGSVKDGDFKTALFDLTQGKQSVQWGGLGILGVETENHSVGLTYLYTRTAEDVATLAEDTRGKEYFFPGYDPDDPAGIGNDPNSQKSAPYLRTETLEYTERTTSTLQLAGKHTLPTEGYRVGKVLEFGKPEASWTLSRSAAGLYQPDKRQFGSLWWAPSLNPGFPPDVPPFTSPAEHFPYKPAANFTLGNLQRIWKEIDEKSEQVALDLKLPFEQWQEEPGYVKLGFFDDSVDRKFDQESFSNFGDSGASFLGDFDEFWSEVFPLENHPITESLFDVDYEGDQSISATYAMVDMPLSSTWNVIGGVRFESTELTITNDPEANATWFPPGATGPVALEPPGVADVMFEQDDVLPAIGLVYRPTDKVTLRGSYSQTVARQTFKELTPIMQQEFLGGPIFIGNPDLAMSSLENHDLRVDYAPYEGGLVAVSWFNKDVEDPIEYVQRLVDFTFTTPVNYPKGELNGYELEVRQDLGRFAEPLEGLSLGANATFIDSEVTLSDDEAAGFELPEILAPMKTRDMTHAPEHLYNFYLTYDIERFGTQAALFYTVEGDTLVAGAAQSEGNFIPSLYAKEYGTLNFSLSQKIGKHLTVQLQGKNLTNPSIEEVYRSEYIDEDVTRSSFTRGREFSLSLSFKL